MSEISYQESHKLYQLTVSLNKSDSSYLYFTLEANEGLCFYSTLEHTKLDVDRKVIINVLPEFKTQVERILSELEKMFEIEYLEKKWISDL
jgi:hypothetical protein